MKRLRIFTYLLVALLLVSCSATLQTLQQRYMPQEWPTQGWSLSTPEEQGISSAKLADALLAMREQDIDIHSLLIIRNGKLVLDAYFYPYDGSTIHDLASVTKSVMPSLVAIAAEQGKVSFDDPVLSFFPEYTVANVDERKERMTVAHLASMSNGLESMCMANDEGTLQEMVTTDDFVQFSLDRKMRYEPGTHFCYDSAGIHLLSPILQEATGKGALEFARQELFAPLGIQNALWESDPQGYNDGWGDLYLHPHDVAKIGYLWLKGGVWEGKQIVPQAWLQESVTPKMTDTGEDDVYGYGWWLARDDALTVYSATGRGGQHIKVVPEWDLVVVTTGGGFDFAEIEPVLVPILLEMETQLPADPEGVAQLATAVEAVAEPPAALPVAPLPEIVAEISGKTFVFAPNPTGVETIAIDFTAADEAILHYTLFGSDEVVTAPIALDGVYRFFPGDHDLPQGYRGAWVDSQTFLLEFDSIANNDHIFYRARFEDGRLLFSVQETAHEMSVEFEGTAVAP